MTTVAASEALSRATQATNELASEFVETRSVTLEWKVPNLKVLFESSKGETKSKCVKSALFDSHRWQIFFYPNSGHEQYCSLYLSCEPTLAEKEKGLAERANWNGGNTKGGIGREGGKDGASGPTGKDAKGPWKREGKFKFTFEARSLDRRMTFKQMEAHDHSFSDTARNWGYANFLKRSDAYFNNPSVRLADALLIVCTIVYSPTPPSPPPLPRLLIPKDLVNAYASLFDDPDYSDVCFRIRPQGGTKRERRLYSAKKVLAGRSDYFDTMFSSGFHESCVVEPSSLPPSPIRGNGGGGAFADLLDDEDEDVVDSEEDDEDFDEDDDSDFEGETEDGAESEESEEDDVSVGAATADSHQTPEAAAHSVAPSVVSSSDEGSEGEEEGEGEGEGEQEESGAGGDGDKVVVKTVKKEPRRSGAPGRRRRTQSDLGAGSHEPFVDAPSAPASPSRAGYKVRDASTETEADEEAPIVAPLVEVAKKAGAKGKTGEKAKIRRPMFEVVVTDAAYTSFRALIYYLYTDSITFAPLASTYHVARDHAAQQGVDFPFTSRRAYLFGNIPPAVLQAMTMPGGAPGPCSAKAIYRLADKIGLPELKDRAYDHIVKSLTVQNIPYEVFGSFSARFEEIKRVEIAFLLEKWNEVRESSSLKKVFQFGLRHVGRFPGFEEVMVRILPNLEYRPPSAPLEEERA